MQPRTGAWEDVLRSWRGFGTLATPGAEMDSLKAFFSVLRVGWHAGVRDHFISLGDPKSFSDSNSISPQALANQAGPPDGLCSLRGIASALSGTVDRML